MSVPEISAHDLHALTAKPPGPIVIDVREPDELEMARVPGVIPIPLGDVVARVAEVPTDGPVHVICAKGGRSMQAATYYRDQGIEAINVAGGTDSWVEMGYPTESGPWHA